MLGETWPEIGILLGHGDIEATARYAYLGHNSFHEAPERITVSIAAKFL